MELMQALNLIAVQDPATGEWMLNTTNETEGSPTAEDLGLGTGNVLDQAIVFQDGAWKLKVFS
jgi:hypothetical protein